jgi:hypothetical protein
MGKSFSCSQAESAPAHMQVNVNRWLVLCKSYNENKHFKKGAFDVGKVKAGN